MDNFECSLMKDTNMSSAAAVSSDQRLYAFGPFPAWLQNHAGSRNSPEIYYGSISFLRR